MSSQRNSSIFLKDKDSVNNMFKISKILFFTNIVIFWNKIIFYWGGKKEIEKFFDK